MGTGTVLYWLCCSRKWDGEWRAVQGSVGQGRAAAFLEGLWIHGWDGGVGVEDRG